MNFSTFLIIFIIMLFIPAVTLLTRKDKQQRYRYTRKNKTSPSKKQRPQQQDTRNNKTTPPFSLSLVTNSSVFSLFTKKKISKLLKKLDLEAHAFELTNIHYRKHEIPKKTGGKRTLHIPSRSLKKVQKKILLNLLYKEKVHPCSYAYRKGKSIVDNAKLHCDQAVIIKMDIRDFFPSINSDKVNQLYRKMGWSKGATDKLTELCTWENGLPQGAPTSPAISNIILYQLDKKLFALARGFKANYTRYADDLTFSLKKDNPKIVRSIIKLTQLAVEKEGFRINFKKGKMNVLRNHQHQRICGITVNSPKPTLSRKERRKLRAIKHHMENGRPTTMTKSQLEGWENYQKMVHSESST